MSGRLICQVKKEKGARQEIRRQEITGKKNSSYKVLVKADIINKGSSYYCYRGVNDIIFENVFRRVFGE
jgi:hypothetical protein